MRQQATPHRPALRLVDKAPPPDPQDQPPPWPRLRLHWRLILTSTAAMLWGHLPRSAREWGHWTATLLRGFVRHGLLTPQQLGAWISVMCMIGPWHSRRRKLAVAGWMVNNPPTREDAA